MQFFIMQSFHFQYGWFSVLEGGLVGKVPFKSMRTRVHITSSHVKAAKCGSMHI